GGIKEAGKMIVNLATDKYGNSVTTAADLVAYMDSLTSEQTRGISASLVYPPGVTPNACDLSGGNGLLKATSYDDICGKVYNDIVFTSCGSDVRDKKPLSEIVAINGNTAGFTLFGKQAGSSLEGTTLKYVALTDASTSPYAEYSKTNNEITVYIREGTTTAKDVQNIIAASASTKDLFEVQLRSDGSGVVSVQDNSVALKDSTYEAGYRGGAKMLWNRDDSSNELYLESAETGSNQFVQIDVLSGTFETVDSYTGLIQSRSYGTDIEATANGQRLQASGNNVSLNTTNLSFTATITGEAEAGDSYWFDIVSGGALFQLGPDVVSAQQVRLGIPSVMTSDLGGSMGVLSDLRSGGRADLSSNESVKLADRIVKDAITAVSSTRGRLGAIQKATLEANMVTLQNSIEALTSARADIIDADFAQESSNLTKYQILVQSGSRVLAISNQLPQYAAQLIG
ncbi:MAG: flagellin, partial [Planctomycetaceae bacterium]|nr:flagellin [Planctomycetaceae bacterium]